VFLKALAQGLAGADRLRFLLLIAANGSRLNLKPEHLVVLTRREIDLLAGIHVLAAPSNEDEAVVVEQYCACAFAFEAEAAAVAFDGAVRPVVGVLLGADQPIVEIAPAASKGDEGLDLGISGLAELLDRSVPRGDPPVFGLRSFTERAEDMKIWRLVTF